MYRRNRIITSRNFLKNDDTGLAEAKEPLVTKWQTVHLSEGNGGGDEFIARLT